MKKIVKNSLGFDSNLYVYQDKEMFNYSVDTILLGNFATVNRLTKYALEIGTNNAALSIFISERWDKLKIDAVEIQEKAIPLAKKNIVLNKKENQINLIHADFKEFAINSAKNQLPKYDLIICNPPFYKVEATKRRKGSKELFEATHEVNMKLEDVFEYSSKIINQKGYIAVVLPTERIVDCFEYMRNHGFEPKRVIMVHPREDKKSNLVLIEARFKSGWGVHYLPNIYLHTDDFDAHEYREEVKALYKPIKYTGGRNGNK